MAQEITDSTLDSILAQDKPVVIDFWAAWCGPCKAVAPAIDKLAADYEGIAVVGKIDVDANPVAAAKYGIRNLPTVLFIHNNEVLDKHVGVAPGLTLGQKLDAILLPLIQDEPMDTEEVDDEPNGDPS